MVKLIDFVSAVQAVLNERGPDYVYDTTEPRYSDDDGDHGSDLFGAALIEKLGIEYMEGWEGTSISVLIDKGAIPIEEDLTPEQLRVFSSMQDVQDEGYTYEEVDNWLNSAVARGTLPQPRPEAYSPDAAPAETTVVRMSSVKTETRLTEAGYDPAKPYPIGNIVEPWFDRSELQEHDDRL